MYAIVVVSLSNSSEPFSSFLRVLGVEEADSFKYYFEELHKFAGYSSSISVIFVTNFCMYKNDTESSWRLLTLLHAFLKDKLSAFKHCFKVSFCNIEKAFQAELITIIQYIPPTSKILSFP